MDEHPPDASESRCDLLLSGGAVITMDDERRIRREPNRWTSIHPTFQSPAAICC